MAAAAKHKRNSDRPKLLVIDGSYSIETIRRLGLEQSVLSRDLDGFFGHVWSVHPFGDLGAADAGPPEQFELDPRHSFIQAKPGRLRALRGLFPVNFALGQSGLLRQLRRLVLKEDIALVRAGDPLYVGLLGWLVARTTGRRFMIRINANNDKIRDSIGGPIYPRLLRTVAIEKRIERFLLPRADLVVAPNQDNVDFALANGARPDRVTVFRYGNLLSPLHLAEPAKRKVDRKLFASLGIAPGKYLICVSRLQELKYPDDTVRALAAARAAGQEVTLLLAGEGPMRMELEALAAELGVADRLRMPGNLDQQALAQLYANAAVVISPLTGRALSEAALGGVPIVAYDLDWQGDLVETGVTGELVRFRDPEAMGTAVIKFLSDPAYASRMGDAVRERAMEMLDPATLNAHERATYARLLGEA